MTLTQFMARSTWVAHAFEWEKLLKCHLKGKASRKLANWQNIDYSEKRKWPKGFICPCTGVQYHNIQTCFIGICSRSQVSVYRTIGPLVAYLYLSKCYRRHYELISKFNVGLKTLLRDGLSEPEFYGGWVYQFKKLIGRMISFQFRKIITRYRRIRGASKTFEEFLNNFYNWRPIVFVLSHVIMVYCRHSCKMLFVESYFWLVKLHRHTRGVCYPGSRRKVSVYMFINIKIF